MSRDGEHSAEPPHTFGDAVDKGLAEAFGDARPQRPAPSVLQALQARTGSVFGLHLESGGLDDAPVRVTEEARKLRDPAGRYQVLGEIGRGGVGIVYKSRDVDLGRDVAMKVLKDEYAQRPDVLARFVEEAQIGGQLQHPGIVPVYELGMHAGEQLYFAMKLVRGETLAAQLARRASPAEDRRRLLGVFEQICQTVAYAHARRVVHRDLKPANVMIGAFGEVQVVDWGFAKVLALDGAAEEAHAASHRASEHSVIETVRSGSSSGAQSVPGSMMGTPAYMPPEQAQGNVELLDRRTDVFALGAILCEILCGEAPYREQDGDLVRQAANAELAGALERLGACGADDALLALCGECLAPARRARPASAAEVAGRVGAWLTSVEERARQAELRAAEARYKQRATLLAGAAGLVVLLLGAGAWIWMQGEVQERRAGAAQRVAAAMSAASGARGQAQAAGLDPSLWSAAVSSAEQLVALARSDDVLPAARAEAEGLLVSVRQEESVAAAEAKRRARDVAMLERLELLRMPTDDDVRASGWLSREHSRLDAAYGEAFAAYLGAASLFEQPADVVLASLEHGDIEVDLATSLDHWALVRHELQASSEAPDPGGTARIGELAAALDPADPWRARLRDLLPNPAPQRASLKDLTEQADFALLNAASCIVLCEALWLAGEKEISVDVLRRGQEVHPTDFDVCFRLALGLQLLEPPRWQEALDTYRVAQALRPEHNEVLHRQGMALEVLGRLADAERIFRMLLAREPSSAHWFTHMGTVFQQQGKTDEAIESHRRALENHPQSAVAYYNLGIALEPAGKLDEAIENYQRAVEIDPRFAFAYYNLGGAFAGQGKLDEAIEAWRRALEVDPQYVKARYSFALAFRRQGKLDEAIEGFRRTLEIDPQYAGVHASLGEALGEQGRLDEAIESFRRSLEIDPQNAEAHASLGDVLGKQGKLDEMIECYRRALEIGPESASVHNSLGLALKNQGRLDEAVKSYRRAIQLDPALANAHVNLGNLLSTRDVEGAMEAFERAAELFSKQDGDFARRWESYAREQIQELRRRPALEGVLTGRTSAASPEEWAEAVVIGYSQGRFIEIVALTEQTLQASREGNEAWGAYNSACAAALLAADGAAELSAAERARIRGLARAWLAREVARWRSSIADGNEHGSEAQRQLERALQDPDFTSLRGDALADLPEPERAAWQELWGSIARALEEDEK